MQAEPRKSLVGEEYEVEVGPVAHGGHCVARTPEGQVLFVRHSLPGERVVARVTEGEEGARFLRADAVRVLEAAKDRIDPPCPYAGPGRCGGCDWQHAKPGAQRRLKGEVVAEQLKRLAGLTPEEAGWDGTVVPAEGDKVPAGEVPAWRTRVQYAVTPDGRAGLRRHRSHEVEPIDHCLIAADGISELGIEKRGHAASGVVGVGSGRQRCGQEGRGAGAEDHGDVEGRQPPLGLVAGVQRGRRAGSGEQRDRGRGVQGERQASGRRGAGGERSAGTLCLRGLQS